MIAVGQRNPRRQQLARQVLPAGTNPDRDHEREPAGNRQARVLEKHPESELVVLQHVSSLASSSQSRRRRDKV